MLLLLFTSLLLLSLLHKSDGRQTHRYCRGAGVYNGSHCWSFPPSFPMKIKPNTPGQSKQTLKLLRGLLVRFHGWNPEPDIFGISTSQHLQLWSNMKSLHWQTKIKKRGRKKMPQSVTYTTFTLSDLMLLFILFHRAFSLQNGPLQLHHFTSDGHTLFRIRWGATGPHLKIKTHI